MSGDVHVRACESLRGWFPWATRHDFFPLDPVRWNEELLNEDFTSGDLRDWTVVEDGALEGPSHWKVVSGELVNSSNLHSEDSIYVDKLGTYIQYGLGYEWTNYQINYTLRSNDNDSLGIMFRVLDSKNYYRFSWDAERQYRRLVKRVNGEFFTLAEDYVPYSEVFLYGQGHQIEINVRGNNIELFVDGQQVFSVIDPDLSKGTIAFYSWENAGSIFDNVVVTSLDSVLNQAPVITVSSEFVSDEGSFVTLDGSAIDPEAGILSYYWTQISGPMISGYENTIAQPIITLPSVVGNNIIDMLFTVTDSDQTLAAEKVSVIVNDKDWLSNLLTEDFINGDLLGWSVFDNGAIDGPSNWLVTEEVLAQTSSINDANTNFTGSYLLQDSGATWTNYQISFTLKSQDIGHVGMMFRVQDENNFYRFRWNHQRQERVLEKVVNGVTTALANDTVPYVIGREYLVVINSVSNNIQVLIDGLTVFEVTDSDLTKGSIALYSSGNAGTYFDNIVVDELASTYNANEVDTDGDGYVDAVDAFPLDINEWLDTDSDGIGNNADTDDDNDSVADIIDAFPLDANESIDTDGDGIGNNADLDDDNDAVADDVDAFPLDATEWNDADSDGTGDNSDPDVDLAMSSVSTTTTEISAGDSFIVNGTIANTGAGTITSGAVIGFYLSSDINIDASDTLIGSWTTSATLSVSQSRSQDISVSIPPTFAVGHGERSGGR